MLLFRRIQHLTACTNLLMFVCRLSPATESQFRTSLRATETIDDCNSSNLSSINIHEVHGATTDPSTDELMHIV